MGAASAESLAMDHSVRPRIELHRLTKTYQEGERERIVLRGLDAKIDRGEFVALLGPSGSGKSTLLNLMGGIDLPTAGDVLIDAASLRTMSEAERTIFRRRHIGFVFQFFNLIHTLTVEENLYLPLELNDRLDRTGRAFAHTLLQRVGLDDRAHTFPDRLSGGEQQRVAIARALVHGPRLVLADEPTGNLDRETGRQIVHLIIELARSAGATLVMVSHSAEILASADRGFRLEAGDLVPITSKKLDSA